MENRTKNILILTYYFPPDPGIGSRRWAKFAKYLHRSGNNVTVLAAETEKGVHSTWDKDISDLNIIRYSRNYPKVLDSEPRNSIQKLKYKWAVYRLSKKVKGTIYDRAVFLEESIFKTAVEIINSKNIDTIIVNGPPHRIMYYGAILKEKFPHIYLISDFRDPWTWWYNYGYPQLNHVNKEAELGMEKMVISKSDLVTVTYPEMKSQIKERYPDAKIEIIPHGFDPEEFSKYNPEINNKIRLVYFGTLYSGEEERFRILANEIKNNSFITLDIFSEQETYKYIFEVSGCGNRVSYYKPIPSVKLFKKLSEYDAFIMILPDKFRNNFSSKFYEVIYSGLHFILYSSEGDLSTFIRQNKSGSVVSTASELSYVLRNRQHWITNVCSEIDQYSFPALCNKLMAFASQNDSH